MTYAWSQSAIHGAGFQNVIAKHPTDPNILMVGGDVAGCHLTVDAGEHWTPAVAGFPNTACLGVAALYWNPTNVDQVFALVGKGGAQGGLYRYSMTSGQWTLVSAVMTGHGGNTTGTLPRPHPRSTGNLIVWNATTGVMIVAGFDDGLWRGVVTPATGLLTTDFAILSNTFFPTGDDTFFIRSIAYDSANDRLWIAARHQHIAAAVTHRPYYLAAPFTTALGTASVETGTGPLETEEIVSAGATRLAVSANATDFGVWRNTGTGTTWTKINDANIPGGKWQSITTIGNVAYAGCTSPLEHATLGDNKNRVCVIRCDDITAATPVWVPITVDGSQVHTTIGDTAEVWWLAEANEFVMIGTGSFVAAQIVALANGWVYVAGRSGVWRTKLGSATTPAWYPAVRDLGVTINRAIAAGEAVGQYVNGNTDWITFATIDAYLHALNAKPSPNACFAIWHCDGCWWAATGHRDNNVLGKVWTSVNPMDPAGWVDTGLTVGSSSGFSGADNFARSVLPGSWGGTWETPVFSGNLAKDNASVNGVLGVISTGAPTHNAISSVLMCDKQPLFEGTFRYTLGWDTKSTGAEHTTGFVFRRNGSDRYELRLRQPTNGKILLNLLRQTPAGGTKVVDTVTGLADLELGLDIDVPSAAGTRWAFHTVVEQTEDGMQCSAKLWAESDSEPVDYTAIFVDNDPLLQGDGDFGFRASYQANYTALANFGFDSFEWDGNQLGGAAGGMRPFGGISFYGADDVMVSLAAVSEDGIWRQVGSGPWAKVPGPPCTGVTSKAIPFAYAGNGVVYVYDRPRGIWRSKDYGLTWEQIINANGNTIGERGGALTCVDFLDVDTVVHHLYFTEGGRLVKALDPVGMPVWTPAASEDFTEEVMPGGAVGALASRHNFLLAAESPGASGEPPHLWMSVDSGATDFVDVADADYRSVALFVFDLAIGVDGSVALPLNGNGVSHFAWSGVAPTPVLPPVVEPPYEIPPGHHMARVRPPIKTRKASSLIDYAFVETRVCLFPAIDEWPSTDLYPLDCPNT